MAHQYEDEDDDFGQKLPPLHIYLKRVLDKYPEGGQILKELVQNADDAGARRVVVVYDKTQHPTDTMWSESLHDFNGPSLYVYNDATFQEQDWKNIQHPEQSGKLDDPTKVGRFGLGFISVYHLTDIPSVLSGKQIGFLDPHEKYFEYDPHTRIKHRGKRGKKWRLSADILNRFPDQFNPYIEPLFNCSRVSFENGCFDGTIFRFPLRNASMESHVSSAVYNDERIRSLFHSYQADADISLLFLKNVETVSLYEKIQGDEQPQLMFSVEVAENDRMKLRSERKKFLQDVTLSKDVSSVCSMNIIKHSYENLQGMASSSNKYVTINLVKKEGISIDLQNLMVDQDLKLLPWVGVSVRVHNDGKGQRSGRVFCFLPLPESERTGLPIHVHGYFGLGDNRRSIKWPDRESEHDKAARWNQLLVHETFPDAYMKLIIEAIDQRLPANDVYGAWPDVSNMKGEWKEGIKEFLHKIKTKPILYTNANGGSWQRPEDVFIDPKKNGLIHRLLMQKNYPIAEIPDHVIRALSWGGIQTKVVTPAIVRKVIRGDPLKWMNRKEKLQILEYITKDKQFNDLSNILLLPLEDGTFTNFSASNAIVYIPSDQIPSDLFPNMSSRFSAKDMPHILTKAQRYTQLKCLTPQMVPTLLKESLPREWVQGTDTVHWIPGAFQQPKTGWLEKIWTWLTQNRTSISITSFTSVALLQLEVSNGHHRLARLYVHPIIYRQNRKWCSQNTTLPETICTYLETLGVEVIRDNLPTFIAQHPDIDTIIRPPDADGVTAVLESSWNHRSIQNVAAGSEDLKRDLRNFFKYATLSDRCKSLLRQLPIFKTTDNMFVSVSQLKEAVPVGFYGVPAPRLRQRFLLENDESDTLAMKLGARRISEIDLLCKYILPDVESQTYDRNECARIMRWVLERPQFDGVVQNLSFVPTERGQRRPMDLFPPDNPHLKVLFTGYALFPVEEYSAGKLLHYLKRVGLRGLSSVTAQEILDITVKVSKSQDRGVATKLLEHLTDFPHLLHEIINRKTMRKPLGKFLQGISWVPCKTVRPTSYPDTLKWYGSSVGLCRPEEVALIDQADLIGSVKPLVEIDHVRSQFTGFFNWGKLNPNNYPMIEQVAQHLQNVVACYQNKRHPSSMTRIINAIYGFLNQAPVKFIRNIFHNDQSLIWNGSGFTTPTKVAFSSGTIRVNLAPYLHTLPSTLNQYSNFLETVGVKQQFTEDALNEVLHIIQEKHQEGEVSSSEKQTDLKLVCDILNSIIAYAVIGATFTDVLVPCRKQQGDMKNSVRMTKSSQCLYVDEERLLTEYDRSECQLPIVHEMIPNQTARRLGLRPLSHSVAPVENIDLGYDVEGPHLSTVNAIKRNLEMYKEGVDIFKELIQNADDAGATEVKFLIDWRDNSQSANGLLSEGMEMCHGPALWAYNDATFDENDVKNICSIAAASKKDQLDKIGRFGLGFTSVYHITDVPSLCSGPFVLVFDPRTNHLGNRINPGRPGIKLDIRNERHRATLRSYPNQFQPFQGIFNCDLSPSSKGFDKTLFRLPLRTEREVSDMSQDHLSKAMYNSQEEMTKMVMALKESAPSLLLFTQNVTNISVLSLSADCISIDNHKTLLDVSVENVKTLPRCIDSQDNIPAQRKILRATQQRMQNKSLPVPESTTVVKVTCKFLMTKKSGNKLLKCKEHLFVVSSCMAPGGVENLAGNMEGSRAGVLPCGGVAVLLGSGKEGRVPISLDNQILGSAFSYLPLDICTGLPFHINGNFLLQPNRRHLWSKSSSAVKVKQGGEFETRWNICFMEEVVCKALINLLVDLQTLQAEDYLNVGEFQILWPKLEHTESDFHPLVAAFFKAVCNPDKEQTPNVLYNGNRWVTMHDCFFIEDAFCRNEVGDAIKAILCQHLYPKECVNLDTDVLQSMIKVGASQCFNNNSYNLTRFLLEVFFPMVKNRKEIPRKQQKAVMLHLLDLRIGTDKRTEFDEQMTELQCFPASPDGDELRSPEQFIHPGKPLAKLFKEEDGRFPYGKDYRREERLLSLAELGMATDNLEWEDVCERAESFTKDTSREGVIEKCVIFLDLIDKKLRHESAPTSQQAQRLRKASFLPVLAKPRNYPLSWHKPRASYISALELFEEKHKYLVGSVHPILDENCLGADSLSNRMRTFLGIRNKAPQVKDVINQLRIAMNQVNSVSVDRICHSIYAFLNDIILSRNYHNYDTPVSSEFLDFIEEMKPMAFVLVDGKFLKCTQLAFEYRGRGGHYLCCVPCTLLKYKELLQVCGVKESFSFVDYAKVVDSLKDTHGDQPLSDKDTAIAEEMLKAMALLTVPEGNKKGILALDQNNILRPITDLTYNDMSWTKPVEGINYTHRSITEYEAKQLGIGTLRQLQLSSCSSGYGFEVQFGQKEELTTRLRGILREYSHKADVLKELLQNADDAGATEIHIVYDPRINDSAKIVGPSWKPMHESPALCVYNNRPFTEGDILGIQKVGVGGKISDATTTGRFGIGFNAVYHLTDCPTFVTGNDKLCVFDPHVKYIPGASDKNPGRLYSLQGPNGCLATFPNMMDGYLSEYDDFDLENGTMFRFPLRTHADESDISDDTYNENSVTKLLLEFQIVAKDSLLFLNSIQRISISEIDPLNKGLKLNYWITGKVSDKGIQYRKELKDLSKQMKVNNETSVSDITQHNWIYTVDVEDSLKRSESWMISQAFGADILDAETEGCKPFKTKAHLPRGGAAALLRLNQTEGHANPFQRKYKAFTFLPLPVYTGLPVHVNGTFELDQSRRNLVKGEDYNQSGTNGEGLIHKWNKLLAIHVIGPAYAKLIQAAGRYLLDPSECNSEKQMRMNICLYERLFPSKIKILRGEWKLVATATLSYIGNHLLGVLPVVKASYVDSTDTLETCHRNWEWKNVATAALSYIGNSLLGSLPAVESPVDNFHPSVTWHHPVSEMSKAFFDNLPDQKPATTAESSSPHRGTSSNRLRNFLLKNGFRLISCNPEICEAFQEAGVNTSFISPQSVMNHLLNIDCTAKTYPCLVSDSVFQNVNTVRIVLEYCLSGAEKPADLNRLPLRLTHDEILNVFSSTDGVYITHHFAVLSKVPELFIHRDLVCTLKTWLLKSNNIEQCYNYGLFKEFTLYELGKHLCKQLPADWKGCTRHIKWTPGTNGHPSEEWMKHFWRFILERCSLPNSGKLQSLAEWPIFPTASGKVVSPQKSKTILYMEKFCDSKFRQVLSSILQKLDCPRVKIDHMRSSEEDDFSALLEPYLALPTKPSDVLTVIGYMLDEEHFNFEKTLTSSECDVLLRYFQEACDDGNELSQTDVQTLKKLPIFPDACNIDHRRSISSVPNCHTVSSCNLPTHGCDLILSVARCTLLEANSKLNLLYKLLQITPMTAVGILLKYVLPNFNVLDQKLKVTFVEHIRDRVLWAASESEKDELYSALESIAFIPNTEGVVHTTDYYYDPTNDVFATMIEQRYLLPEEFNTNTWRNFLLHIGLQHVVNQNMFTKFAKQIAVEGTRVRNEADHERVKQKAEKLVKQLDNNEMLWNSAFLRGVADIKFIPSVPIDNSLKEIHPPYTGDQNGSMSPFISYRGSVPHHFKELAWTVAMMLPSWAIPKKEHSIYDGRYKCIGVINVHQCLGIETDIIMDKVLLHIQKVCQHMAQRNAFDRVDTVSKGVRRKLTSVIEKMMKYLKDHLPKHQAEIKRRLEFTPICPVEDGKVLVLASQLVIEMDVGLVTERYLRPYLFKAPRELSYCDAVLRALGTQDAATFDQLAGVLKEIHTNCKEERMGPNEKNAAHAALACMFLLLYQSKGECRSTVTELYFPTSTGKLKRSTNLYYADAHHVEKLSKSSTKLDFTVPLKQVFTQNRTPVEDTSESQLIKLLPTELQPHDLRKVLHENLCPTNEACPQEDGCPFLVRIKRMITSEEMQRVLLRLVQNQNHHKVPTERQKTKIAGLLKFDNVRCMVTLKTVLCDSKDKVVVDGYGSNETFPIKMKNVQESVLYIKHQDNSRVSRFLFPYLAKNINYICNLELDHERLFSLREVVACPSVEEMNDVLTCHCRIPEYDNPVNEFQSDTEKPGSPVPPDIWHLLDDDPFNEFHPGEIAVYKRPVDDDPSQSYNQNLATVSTGTTSLNEEYYYVFACIVEKLPGPDTETDSQVLNRKYKIDVGESKYLDVSVVMLYKFRRPREATETTIALFKGNPDSEVPKVEARESNPENIEDAKSRIHNAVREAFSLQSEKEQNEAIRRLYKMWHPDKNSPEESQLYTQAFQFLKQEIERQKKGGSSDFYSQRYNSWESDIRREREQERNYQQRSRYESHNTTYRSRRHRRRKYGSSGSYIPRSFCRETPDPRKARLWYRQAEGMLQKAKEEYQASCNSSWLIVFLLHQVVEKALKAAKFYQNGNADTESTDLLALVINLTLSSRSEELRPLITKLVRLGVDFKKPREPESKMTSMQSYIDFPTGDALNLCKEILIIVREIVGIQPI